jgi:YVTN family beta-propeller protein
MCRLVTLLALVPLLACGGHTTEDPTTVPIAAITHDAVFVVNGGDSTISVIDATTDEVAGTIRLEHAEFPHHAYLSPDRSILLVAAPGVDLSGGHGGGHGGHDTGGVVLALDATTGALRAARRLDAPNHNAVFAPGGGAIWTTQIRAPGEVLVLDPVTLATRKTIAVGDEPSEVTFASSGAYAFVANTASDTVTAIDPTSGSIVRTIPVGDGPVGAWPASDGRMYVDNEAGRSLTVIDATTLDVVRTIDLGFTPALAVRSPGGELWVADPESGRVVAFDATTGSRTGELATGAGAHAIAFSADGAKAYVTNQLAGTVSVVTVATKTAGKTIVVGVKPNGLVYRSR